MHNENTQLEIENKQPLEGEWSGKKQTAGWTDRLTNDEYHAVDWAISSSYVKTMLTRGQAAADVPHADPTPSMRIGTAVHTMLLEGLDRFEYTHAVQPDGLDMRTKAGKEWKAEQLDAGRIVINKSEWQTIAGASNAVLSFQPALHLMADANTRERSFFWQDGETGVWCKARPDAYGTDSGGIVLADLKTCASLDTFERDIFTRGYDVQGAFYLRGLHAVLGQRMPEVFGAPDFWLLAVETSAPYRVGLYYIEPSALAEADKLIDLLLWQVKTSHEGFGDLTAEAYRATDLFTGNKKQVTPSAPPWIVSDRAEWADRVNALRNHIEERPF